MAIYVGNKRYAPYIGDKRRRYMGGGSSLPYDAEVEYLESTSTSKQYIDTGITDIWDGLVVTLDISVTDATGERDFFGSRNPTGGYNYAGCFRNLDKNFVLQIGSPYVRYGQNDGDRHIHIYDAINKTCSLDDSITSASTLTWRGSGNDTFKLFQRVLSNGKIQSPSDNKLYASQFVKDGVLVRDYIPVRVGTIGYLYDKVSGELFGNAGTGDFVLGPDKN